MNFVFPSSKAGKDSIFNARTGRSWDLMIYLTWNFHFLAFLPGGIRSCATFQ